MNFFLLLVTILCAITNCLALRDGAPSSACFSLMPVHRGTSLQQDNAPYNVNVDKIGQNKVRVTITSPIGEEIKGFMLQARSAKDRSKFIAGEFKSNDESKTVDCSDRKRSTLTHSSPSAKSQVTTEWTATSPVNEDIIFRATVAKSYAVYWKDIDSKPVSMRTGGQVTPTAQRNSNFLSIYDACFKSKGCFGMPQGCIDRGDCEVLFTYERNSNRGIRFTLHGLLESSEYMAVGLSDDDKMGEDYVTECFRDSANNGKLRNSWNENDKSNSRTTETNDDYDFTFRNGLTTCSWTKPYTISAFGRTYDLSNNKYHILLAKGPVQNNRLRYHPSRLPSGDAVDLTTVSAVSGGGVTDSVKIHGTFMVTGWIGFVSIAILLARHFKNVWETSTLGGVKIWFALHRGFMLTALVFIIIAFIVIFVHKNGWNYQTSNPHAILGCIATCLGLLNPIMALFRPAPDHPKRVVFNWLHFIVGNGAHLIAVITIFFAVRLPSSGLTTRFYWVMAIFVIVHVLFHLLYQVHTWTDGKKKNNELSMNEINGARGTSVQNGHNSQAKKITSDVFRILLLSIYSIFLLAVLIALYALIGSA